MPPNEQCDNVRRRFVDDLREPALDAGWAAAFAAVPREHFVPYWFTQRPGEPGWLLVTAPDPMWLEGVYSATRALITQIGGDPANVERARTGRVHGPVTSSSSAPTLMAAMLRHLHARPGHSVLEIGTGTGYNAALLCQHLGADRLTSVDVDEHLVAVARQRLAELGHAPYLAVGDGALGNPERAPFDRIIATVAVERIPTAWLTQCAAGGRMVVPVDLAGRGGLVAALDIDDDGGARGRFLPLYGGFMSLRTHQLHAPDVLGSVDPAEGDTRKTDLPVQAVTDASHPFEFMAGLTVGGYDWVGVIPDGGGPTETWLTDRNDSWACHTADAVVRQGGPRRLWDRLESAHERWLQLGRPLRERFGLTIAGDGIHTLWLDAEEDDDSWTLPTTPVDH